MDKLKSVGKNLKGTEKTMEMVESFLKFFMVTLPKTVFNVTERFTNKARPVYFVSIVIFIVIFFGIQIAMKYLTGVQDLVPHTPLALFTFFIIYTLVMSNGKTLKKMQNVLLRIFLIIFDNPMTKHIYGFDIDVDNDDPSKDMNKIFAWAGKNIAKVMFTLFVIAFFLRYIAIHSIKHIRLTYSHMFSKPAISQQSPTYMSPTENFGYTTSSPYQY